MAARKPVVTPLATADELAHALAHALAQSTRALVVLDVHQAWCGPCTVVETSYRKLALEYGDARLRFHTVEHGLLPPALRGGVPASAKPTFLLLRDGVVLSRVAGVNVPDLEAQVAESVPPAVEAE